MAVKDEIIAWGRANGWTINDDGRLPSGLRAAYDRRDATENEGVEITDTDEETTPQERAPIIAKPTVADRARSIMRTAPKRSTAKKSGARKPRVSVDRFITTAWAGLARITQQVNIPVARVLAVQAPVAGLLLEDVVKNTVVDKALQPLARAGQGGEMAIALMGPPLLVAALTTERVQQDPRMQAVLVPLLRESLKTWIEVAGPKLEVQMQREKEFQEKYGETIDTLIGTFFAPVEAGSAPEDYTPHA